MTPTISRRLHVRERLDALGYIFFMSSDAMTWPEGHSYTTLSWLTAIPKSNLSAYRHGAKRASSTIAERISWAGASDPAGPIVAQRLVSYPQLARAIKSAGMNDPVHATRLVRQTVAHLATLHDESDIRAFHIKPPTTGDPRWNALIGGLAMHTWSLAGYPVPLGWAEMKKPLRPVWEPGFMPERWRMWNLVNTPPSLRERGVSFPRDWLEAA
jgi:hypothetical protein